MNKNHQFKLTVHPPQGSPWPYEINSETISIGRLGHNDIVLPDDRVSRTHAIMTLRGDLFQIADQQSANGTSINGKEMPKGGMRTLKNGDEITIGNHKLTYQATALAVDDAPIAGGTMQLQNAAELLKMALTSGGSLANATATLSAVMKKSSNPALAPKALKPDESQAELELLRKRSQMLGFMYELNKTLSNAFSAEDIYKKVADQIFQLIEADRVVFATVEEGAVKVNWIGYQNDKTPPSNSSAVSTSVIKKVIGERVSIISIDPILDPNFQGSKTFALGMIKSLLCAPLMVQEDSALGAIYLDSGRGTSFSNEDLNFLTAVASIAAIAIQKISAHDKLLQEAQARIAYQRFLPPFVIEQIIKDPNSLELGGVNQTVTMMFADIRGFTTLSERKSPRQMVQLLNRYFDMAANQIYLQHGTLDKFIGDGIMALFGAPTPSDEDILNAIRAAIGLQVITNVLNAEFAKEEADFRLGIGIGINTGEVIAGFIGSQLRTDYTVIGDSVNLAARLESRAEPGHILLGELTYKLLCKLTANYQKVGDDGESLTVYHANEPGRVEFNVIKKGIMQVKGKVHPVMVYQVEWDLENKA